MRGLARIAALGLTLFCSACSSIHEALHIKRSEEPLLHLTLLPQGDLRQDTPTQVDAKITHISTRALVTHAEIKQQEADTLSLFAIDNTFNDFQPVSAAATGVDGLYRFRFTPRSARGYRIWAEAALRDTPVAEYPFADIGSRSPGSFPRAESLTHSVDGVSFTLALKDPLRRFRETPIRVEAAGTPVIIHEVTGFYSDYRTLAHILPVAGEEPRLSPDKEGFIKLFIRVSYQGKMRVLPFVAAIARD